MRITHTLSQWPESAYGSVMALGNFDGMHRGHQAVIREARFLAEAQGAPLAVMTFEPHPRRFFRPDLPILRIVPFSEKARLLRDAGVGHLYVARFDAAFSRLPASAFIGDVLLGALRVRHVVTGHNFAFGHRRSGDVTYLRERSQALGFGYTKVQEAGTEEGGYSSTVIREALAAGDVDAAVAVLGRPYVMRGHVIHGDKRGRSIGFPTANIRPAPLFLPRHGVYAVRLWLDGEAGALPAVANLGLRPTLDGSHRLLEVHAFDTARDMYGLEARVEFVKFIRPERKFSGIDALKAQIAQDVMATRAIHEQQQKVQA